MQDSSCPLPRGLELSNVAGVGSERRVISRRLSLTTKYRGQVIICEHAVSERPESQILLSVRLWEKPLGDPHTLAYRAGYTHHLADMTKMMSQKCDSLRRPYAQLLVQLCSKALPHPRITVLVSVEILVGYCDASRASHKSCVTKAQVDFGFDATSFHNPNDL